MEIIKQYSEHHAFPPEKIRPASRGLVIKDGKVLLSYETHTGVYMSPGGGREAGESFEDCCIRELREETGYIVKPVSPFIIIEEYCFETCYEAHYFLCEIEGECESALTPTEIEHGITPVWIELDKAMEIFSAYGEKAEDHMSLYRREFTVIGKYIEQNRL